MKTDSGKEPALQKQDNSSTMHVEGKVTDRTIVLYNEDMGGSLSRHPLIPNRLQIRNLSRTLKEELFVCSKKI